MTKRGRAERLRGRHARRPRWFSSFVIRLRRSPRRLSFASGCLRCASAVILLLLAGCFDYDEDLTVFGNGAGTFGVTLSIDEQALAALPPDVARRFSAEAVKAEFAKVDGVKLDRAVNARENGRQTLRLDGSFRSLPELAARADRAGGAMGSLGKVTYREDGRRVRISRVVDFIGLGGSDGGAQLPGPADAVAQGVFAALLNGHALTFRAHFPSEIVNANAARLDPKTGTAEWSFPLAAALRDPPVMTVELRRPNPFVPWLVGAVLLVPVAYTAWRLFGRRMKDEG